MPTIVILLGLVLCSLYIFSLTSADLHKTWTQPVKDRLPQAVVFDNIEVNMVTVSIRFTKVFTVGGVHRSLLGQALALWLETDSACQRCPGTSKPTCLVCCVVVCQVLVSQAFSCFPAWQCDRFCLWLASLSVKRETWSSRVPENAKKQKRPCKGVGDVTVVLTSTSFRWLDYRHPHRAGCIGLLRETRNTEVFWITALRQDETCPRIAHLSSVSLVAIWVTQVQSLWHMSCHG